MSRIDAGSMTKEHYIYPVCPSCEEQSEEGVPFRELPWFFWKCSHCGSRHEGWFTPERTEVNWLNEDLGRFTFWIKRIAL